MDKASDRSGLRAKIAEKINKLLELDAMAAELLADSADADTATATATDAVPCAGDVSSRRQRSTKAHLEGVTADVVAWLRANPGMWRKAQIVASVPRSACVWHGVAERIVRLGVARKIGKKSHMLYEVI